MINYLIDSENIGTKWISYLDKNIEELDKAFLFYTDASKSISCKELSVLFSFIHQLETIHCQNGTANALDFQLASYLGYLIRMDTKSTYCILTQDKGYDVVVNFWKEKGIHIYRCGKFIEESELKQIQDVLKFKKNSPATNPDFVKNILPVPVPAKKKNLLPPLGSLLSLKKNNPTLKRITEIVQCTASSNEVKALFHSSFGKKQGTKYYQKIEKHLRKYYNEV